MDTYTKIIIFLIILLICVVVYKKYYSGVENFNFYNSYYKQFCPSCGWRNRRTCSKCINCAYCISAQGEGSCVPGDSRGPFFRNDCAIYEYGNTYSYYPNSAIYPVVTVKSTNPYFEKKIKQPYEWVNAETVA